MIPMLLVVGSLVPASDSPELTTAPPPPRAAGATVDVRDLVREGMRIDEMERLLGRPTKEIPFFRGSAPFPQFWHRYERFGIVVESAGGRVVCVTRFTQTK